VLIQINAGSPALYACAPAWRPWAFNGLVFALGFLRGIFSQ
jgi:hypothetical protein